MAKRVFLIVLDSFGVGAEPDAPFSAMSAPTHWGAIAGIPISRGDNLARLGMFNLDGVTCGTPAAAPSAAMLACVKPVPARIRPSATGKSRVC